MSIKISVDISKFSKTSTEYLILSSSLGYLRDVNAVGIFLMVISRDPGAISMRKLEEFVMHYSRNHNIYFYLDGKKYYIYQEYQKKISDYRKKNFCFFRREDKINIQAVLPDNKKLIFETTPGQANLFCWLIRDRILDYILDNYEAIWGSPLPKELKTFREYLGRIREE